MKRLLLLSLAAISLFGWQARRPAPEFVVHMDKQPDLRLSAYRGKVVMLALLNTGCEHCQHFAQELQGLERDYAAKGLQVLAAVFDTDAKNGLANFRAKFVKGYPIGYSDEATVLKWIGPAADQGYFVPIVAFIDKRGQLVSVHLGDDALFQDPEHNIRKKLDSLVK